MKVILFCIWPYTESDMMSVAGGQNWEMPHLKAWRCPHTVILHSGLKVLMVRVLHRVNLAHWNRFTGLESDERSLF